MGNYTREEVLQMAEDEDVEFIRLQFTDMFGTLKNIAITARELPRALMDSMKPMVPKIVSTPVNSWVNPIRSPSENWLTSETIRLKISPGWFASI